MCNYERDAGIVSMDELGRDWEKKKNFVGPYTTEHPSK